MDTKTGQIHEVADAADAEHRGLVPIPAADVERVRRMTPAERKEWVRTLPSSMRRKVAVIETVHPLHSVPVDDRRAWRNQRKAERRARRAA